MFPFLLSYLSPLFDTPKDQGADGQDPSSTPPDDKEQPAAEAPDDKKQEGESPEQKAYTQEQIDAIVEARLKRDREKREREAQKAKEEQAAKAGEFESLAEQRAARIAELEPAAERAERYAEVLNRQAEATVAGWPDELKALDPGPDDLDARLAWIEKSRPLAEKLGAAPKAPDTDAGKGSRPSPKPNASKDGKDKTGAERTYRFQGANDVAW